MREKTKIVKIYQSTYDHLKKHCAETGQSMVFVTSRCLDYILNTKGEKNETNN